MLQVSERGQVLSPWMTAEAFGSWMSRLALSLPEVSATLDQDLKAIIRYQEGTLEIPRAVALACWALEYGAPRDAAPFTPAGRSRRAGEPSG